MAIDQIRDAILSGDRSEETYANLPLPQTYRAATVHKDDVAMFEGLASRDKDPRKSLHIDDVEIPELALGADHDVAVVVAKHGRVEAEPAEGDESADVPATKAAKDDE